MSLELGPDTAFISEIVSLLIGTTLNLLERKVSLLIEPDITFIRKGTVPAFFFLRKIMINLPTDIRWFSKNLPLGGALGPWALGQVLTDPPSLC